MRHLFYLAGWNGSYRWREIGAALPRIEHIRGIQS